MKNEDNPKYEDNPKNIDNLKNEDYPKNQDYPKNDDDPKMKMRILTVAKVTLQRVSTYSLLSPF